MADQLHKRFSTDEVARLLECYLNGEIPLGPLLEILGIKRRRFFGLLRTYRMDPRGFSIAYTRKSPSRRIAPPAERAIMKELKEEKRLIEDTTIPLDSYNYSYIKDRLSHEYGYTVSLPTIITRAKREGFYIPHKKKRRSHDRELLTNYAGELIQHDSSHHRFSPYAATKWHLITSLDDHSRLLLYHLLVEKETSWDHIQALEEVFITRGYPLKYYVDSHSIFRFVQRRDSMWRHHYLVTDEATTQWQMVLSDCKVKVDFALSPQARGKVERPYRWIQDRLVRTCAREGIRTIEGAQEVLESEVHRYNYRQVHSTTGEVPIIRFERALREKRSLFREFTIPSPYESVKDIFCLRVTRKVDAYHKVSLNNLTFRVHKAPLRSKIELRIAPDLTTGMAEVRIWYKDILTDVYQAKNTDLKVVHF